MLPIEKYYVEMCNWAHGAIERERLLGQLSNEGLQNLAALVHREIGDETPSVMLALIKAVVDDEILLRQSDGARMRPQSRTSTAVMEVPF